MVLPAASKRGGSKIQIVDIWRWKHGARTKYFDTTVFFFDFRGELLETLDYRNTSVFCARAATHSGDMMTLSELMGKHVINIDLAKLNKVKSMYVVLSSFQNTTLSQIRFPEVSLHDRNTNTQMCEYTLSNVSTKQLQEHSSVLMCRVFRNTSRSSWRVEALGRLGHGDALDYDPILEMIKKEL